MTPRGRALAVLAGIVLGVGGVILYRPLTSGIEPAAPLADPETTYDPVQAGEELPDGYRVALPRDAILPVYEPSFTRSDSVDWPADMLVLGLAGRDAAKAYPITHLNSREMVNDTLEGIPILVSW